MYEQNGSKVAQIDLSNSLYLASSVEKIEALWGGIVGIPARNTAVALQNTTVNNSATRVEPDLFYACRDEAGCPVSHCVTINSNIIDQLLSKIERSKNHSRRDLRFKLILQDHTVFEDQKRVVIFLIQNSDVINEIDLRTHPISDVLTKLILQAVGAMNRNIRLSIDLSSQLLNDQQVQDALIKVVSNGTYIHCPSNSSLESRVGRVTKEIEEKKHKTDNRHVLKRMFDY